MTKIMCYRCQKEIEPTITEKIFSNGVKHLKASCPDCKNYIKFLSQEKSITEIIMPFGKYKDVKVLDIPLDYLYFLLKNNIIKGNLRNQIESLLNKSSLKEERETINLLSQIK